MIDDFLVAKWLHVLGATVLFGTGIGIAFFMWMAHRGGDPATVAAVGRIVVRADWTFTLTAGIAQPATGAWLIALAGRDPTERWLLAAYALYLLALACWLPVVRLQIRATRLAEAAAATGAPLPPAYDRAMRAWFWLGWPAFLGLLAAFWLMVAKPEL